MNIKMFISDLDGVLSDGMYQVDENGKISKNFYTRDFDALRQLSETGIDIFIITSSDDRVIIEKCKRLSFMLEVRVGIIDKKSEIDKILSYYPNTSWENIAYIGDAENDIECLKAAGFSGCPSDAIEELSPDKDVLKWEAMVRLWRGCNNLLPFTSRPMIVDFISKKPGGRGAVYDFAMEVLKRNNEI